MRWKNASDFCANVAFERRIVGSSLMRHLHRALGPAELLRLEGRHLDGQLGRRGDLGQVDEASSRAAARGTRGPCPRSACRAASRRRRRSPTRRQMPAVPLKLKKRPDQLRPACSMMKWPSSISACTSVSAEKSRLTCSQRHCTTATRGSLKWWIAALEDVGQRQEVGVEDQDELALGGPQAVLERARLEAGAVDAVDVLDVQVGEAPRAGRRSCACRSPASRRCCRRAPGSGSDRAGSGCSATASSSRSTTYISLKSGSCTVTAGSSEKLPERARALVAVSVVEPDQRASGGSRRTRGPGGWRGKSRPPNPKSPCARNVEPAIVIEL